MWRLKVLIQFILAHLPGGERINYGIQALTRRHSPAATAFRIDSYSRRIAALDGHRSLEGSIVVEIGTGWEPTSALLFYLLGARSVHTYDHQRHVRTHLARQVVQQMCDSVAAIGSATGRPDSLLRNRLRPLSTETTLDGIFKRAGINYHAPADATQTGLPDHSADIIYSYAVLEHVPSDVVRLLSSEAARILGPGGIAFHGIRLHDHYASVSKNLSRVNFLRYPEWLWTLLVQNSISYHNRLRECQFLDMFRACGATIVHLMSETDPNDVETVKRMRVDKHFANMTPEELSVTYMEVVLEFAARPADLRADVNLGAAEHRSRG